MKKSTLSAGLAFGLMVVCLLTGMVIGMLVMYGANKNKPEPVSEQPKIEAVHTEEVTNFYYPVRNIKSGHILKNSWEPDGFRIDDGFMAYFDQKGNKISHLGVDVSYHQRSIDWDELMASPVEFMMLRCGYRGYSEGGLIEDEKFAEYAAEANNRGLNLGVYFFTQAVNEKEAIAEADYVINLIKDYRLQYPVAFDTEFVSDSEARTNVVEITPEERSKICIAFCERIREAGYFPIIYASENWLRRELDLSMLGEYDIWAPQYLDENDFLYDFTIWQYTDKGNVPGIDGEVDLNISMVDYAEFVPGLYETVNGNGEIRTYGENIVIPEMEEVQPQGME